MTRPDADRSAVWLMTTLFVRRIVDNDLLSPHADRHEGLAVAYAAVLSAGVFATVFLSIPYLAALVQLPGLAALSALGDRFLFMAASMAIGALAALLTWEALSVEPRDTAVLGPLPVSARAIARAKIVAALVFAAMLTATLNGIPSVLYPAFLTLNIRGIRGTTILSLIAAQATTVTMAGLTGFLAVLALRGTLRSVFGASLFRRLSTPLQTVLMVGTIAAFLLAPAVRRSDVRRWMNGESSPPLPARPVLWCLSANEVLSGHLVADTPVVLPPLLASSAFSTAPNDAARRMYHAMDRRFGGLARLAWLSFPILLATSLATFLWSNRRLPEPPAVRPGSSRIGARARTEIERCTAGDPEAQAGFFFTLQTLSRSSAHRSVVAVALASGVTHALLVLSHRAAAPGVTPGPSTGVFALAVMLALTLLGGIAYAVKVPAAPGANWAIRMAWSGDDRRYLAGVKRAALLLVAMLFVVLTPLHIGLLGASVALVHSLFGLLLAAIALDVMLLSYWQLPFACGHVPVENPKVVWPAALVVLLLVTYGFADIERAAVQTTTGTFALAAALVTIALAVRAADRARRRDRRPMDFEGRPATPTQRLGLLDHLGAQD